MNCVYSDGERQLIIQSGKHIDWVRRMFLRQSRRSSVRPSGGVNGRLRRQSAYRYFCLRSTPPPPRVGGITAEGRRDLTKEATEICLSVFFFQQIKMWELLFYPEWVSGEWHTVKTELCTSVCLPRLSVCILAPKIDTGREEAETQGD